MGIERIVIEGFRSLKHVVWEPSNLNVLIGPNGSGKSNLLDALRLLSAAASGSFEDLISKWRGFRALTWDYAYAPVSYHVGGKLLEGLLPGTTLDKTQFQYALTFSSPFKDGDYVISEESLEAQGKLGRMFSRDIGDSTSIGEFFREENRKPRLGARTENADREILRQMIANWRVYQSIAVGREAEIRRSVEARRIEIADESGRDLVSVLHTHYVKNLGFSSAIDDAMRAAFGTDYAGLSFPPAEHTRVQLGLRWNSLTELQSATDLSDGIVRFLLLVTILSTPKLPPLIAIDEPETGLHPSMLPIIAEYAVEASRKTQVILTTHSPEMLSAFRGTIPKVTVALWEDGQTILKTPPEDILQHWLSEYSLGHLMSSGQLEEMANR